MYYWRDELASFGVVALAVELISGHVWHGFSQSRPQWVAVVKATFRHHVSITLTAWLVNYSRQSYSSFQHRYDIGDEFTVQCNPELMLPENSQNRRAKNSLRGDPVQSLGSHDERELITGVWCQNVQRDLIPWLHVKYNYFTIIISHAYCISWTVFNMFIVSEIILK